MKIPENVIKRIKISSIKGADYNPRADLQPGDPRYEKIKNFTAKYGDAGVLVWNKRTKTLISGHQRLKIFKELGLTEVYARVVNVSVHDEKIMNIALNQLGGMWIEEMLKPMLVELGQLPEVDLTLTGFDLPDIDSILDKYADDQEIIQEMPESVEPHKEPITRIGEVIALGEHRVMCGDSTDFKSVEALMGGERAGLVLTDPPYCANYSAEQRPTNKRETPRWAPILNDDLSESEYASFLEKSFSNMRQFLAPGAVSYIFNGFAQFGKMYDLLTALDFHVGGVIVWEKPNFSPSFADYQWQCEFLLYSWLNGNGAHRWYGPPDETNIWKISRSSKISHPTTKPVELAMRALRNSSQRGDVVLDLFLGSGSTLFAAERLKRRCFGLELDARYVDGIATNFIKNFGRESVSPEIFERYGKEV
ncbi:MAG TPA: DNA modification methylase [Candidatus Omnitrophota bacterium]|nr:DNA modification methylase [Candidatus Omnitrophota bacterium]